MIKAWIFLFALGFTSLLHAQKAGDLDSAFGSGGKLLIDVDDIDHCSKILATADRIYLAGYTRSINNLTLPKAVIACVDHDGNPVSAFAENGILQFDFPGFQSSRIESASLTDDGILVFGNASQGSSDTQSVVLAKVGWNGQPDSTFGNHGFFEAQFLGFKNDAGGVEALDDGRILVCGTTYDSNFTHKEVPFFGRLSVNGTPDETFSDGGFMTWESTNGFQPQHAGRHEAGGGLFDITIVDDEHYVMCGYFSGSYWLGMVVDIQPQRSEPFQMRYFLVDGDISGIYRSAIARQGIVYLGAEPLNNFSDNNFILQSLTDSITIEQHYEVEFSGSDAWLKDMALDDQDRIILAGQTLLPTHNDPGITSDHMALVVMETPFLPDASFGLGGRAQYRFEEGIECAATSAAAVGNYIFAGGFSENIQGSNERDFALIKVHNPQRPLGISRPTMNAGISVFPNPANEVVQVELSESHPQQVSLQLHTMDGKLLRRQTGSTMDVSSIHPGLYLLEVTTSHSSQGVRLIVQ